MFQVSVEEHFLLLCKFIRNLMFSIPEITLICVHTQRSHTNVVYLWLKIIDHVFFANQLKKFYDVIFFSVLKVKGIDFFHDTYSLKWFLMRAHHLYVSCEKYIEIERNRDHDKMLYRKLGVAFKNMGLLRNHSLVPLYFLCLSDYKFLYFISFLWIHE